MKSPAIGIGMDGWMLDHSVKSSILHPIHFFFLSLLYLHISAQRRRCRFMANIIFLFVHAFPSPIQPIYLSPSYVYRIIFHVSIHCILFLCISYLLRVVLSMKLYNLRQEI